MPPSSDCANGAARCTAMGKTAEERLYKRHPGMRQRRITPRNPIRTTRQRRAHGASAGTTSMRFGDAPLPHHRRLPHPSDCPLVAIHRHRRKTAEERFNMLARGWLAYPVMPTHHQSTAEERLYKRHPGMRQRRITPRNPTRTTWRDTTSMRFGDALLPPLGAAHPHRKKPPPIGSPTPWL